jgi:hypothetical protein
MQLLKARLNGVGSLAQSDWFDLSPGLNFFHIPSTKLREAFLRQLATLNPLPPFSCAEAFGDVPATLSERSYPRQLNPSKRTTALAVFAADPSLIVELGKIESILDGVDRIEVGRRLDGSRWLNFVEIASACRWREIDADVALLLEALRQHHPAIRQLGIGITSGYEPSQRIKDNLEKDLAAWLSRVLEESAPIEMRPLAERVFHEVTRPSRVAEAKRLVVQKLPTFIHLSALVIMTGTTGTNSRIPWREGLGPDEGEKFERIVLIDGDEAGLTVKLPEVFGNLLEKLAEDCQVIYAYSDTDLLQESHPNLARRNVPGLR